jgi:SAM-dependent methyltransferase
MHLSELAVPYTLARMLPVLPPAPARLVEVGGGHGALAAALRHCGYHVTVVEPDAESAQACRDRGLSVVQAPVESFEGGGYDAVLFTRVLHHVPDPAAAVRLAGAACRSGGVVVVEDFARDEVDLAAAGFVYDSRAVLAAAGLLPDAVPGTGPHAGTHPVADTGPHAGRAAGPDGVAAAGPDGVAAAGAAELDPLARWRDVPAEMLPIHPGAAVLAAVAGLGGTRTVERTETLWRSVFGPDGGDATRLRPVAAVLRAVELRRIADGTLPAIGIFAVSASG